jgi:2-phospho-L-lactate/phosphoenolpyruvate guanylyltransferase
MVADVMAALARTEAIAATIVVTAEDSVALAAGEIGAAVVADEHEDGQSAAAGLGIARALADGAERVLCVSGDCPALEPLELELLLAEDDADAAGGGAAGGGAAGGGARVVILPDRHGTGTNGLLLAPPGALAPSFGPESCARHVELARAAGAEVRVRELPSLLLDIDTGADLAALRKRLYEQPRRALRTRAVLLAYGDGDRDRLASRA